jgi:hypothetical protein
MLYFTLFISELEYVSVVRNSIASTDANELESIQHKFLAFCFNRSFPDVYYNCAYVLEQLELQILRKRGYLP